MIHTLYDDGVSCQASSVEATRIKRPREEHGAFPVFLKNAMVHSLLEEEGCCLCTTAKLEEEVEMPCHRGCVVTPEYSC